jgi:hypothetical protein
MEAIQNLERKKRFFEANLMNTRFLLDQKMERASELQKRF